MGCWNGSCMISGLSINVFDRVVAIPMILSDGKWLPVSLPFRGKYNDYGSLEDIDENIHTKDFFNWFVKNAKKSLNYEDMWKTSCSDKPVELSPGSSIWLKHQYKYSVDDDNKPIENIEEVLSILEREGCRNDVCHLHHVEYSPFSICLVLEDVYNYVVETTELSDWVLKEYNELNDFLDKFTQPDYKIDEKTNFTEIFKASDNLSHLCSGERYYNLTYNINDLITDTKKEYLKIIVDHLKFRLGADQLRKPYSLPASAGSQDQNYDAIVNLNNFVNGLAQKMKKNMEDMYDEEEDNEQI